MASKKTGRKDDAATRADTPETDAPGSETVGAEAVVVSDADASKGASQDAPETVDAEIVDEDRRDEPMAAAPADTGRTGGTGGGADGDGPNDGNGKKKGAGGFIVGLLVLAAVLAGLFFLFQDDILGTDEPTVAEETTPGVVVSEAEPFPGNELDGDVDEARRPVTAEAAPGARAAAVAADAERAADADAGSDTTVSALRARAAEQARLRREAREGGQDAQGSRPRTGFVSEDGESEMAAAVRRARAEQARIRREDRERAAALRARDAARTAPVVAGAQAQESAQDEDDAEVATDRDARIAALRAQRERDARGADARDDGDDQAFDDQTFDDQAFDDQAVSDDPNALPGFTADADDADQDQGEGDTAATLRDRMAQQGQDEARDDTRAARPTGRIRPIAPTRDADEEGGSDDPNALAQQDQRQRPRPIEPRPPVIRTAPDAQDDRTITPGMVPSSVATDEELEERLDAVEADLRDALRQDLRAEVREDVLAEASQRIDQAIRQTEAEVAQLRTRLGEQEARSDQRIAQLRDRLEVLQDRDASANTRGVLILALSNLRGQLDAGQPFERQLDDVERVAPNVTTLREARRFARTGLPTDADLRERFRDAEREALRLEAGEGADGFFGGMWANIKGLFTVREIGEVEGEDTEAVISRARAALARGEVGAAVQEIDRLDGVAAEAFAPFVEEARAKSATKLQIQRLERAVLNQPTERG